MYFQDIQLTNFRSYKNETFELSPKTTVITGPNGSGKTNILEGLHLLSNTKSFRALDRELVKHRAEWYKVSGHYQKKLVEVRYELGKNPPKKTLINQQKVKTEEYIGQVKTVLFEPDMLAIVGGSPEVRRRFLDNVLSMTHPEYFRALVAYRRILKQRNALLRDSSRAQVSDQIFAWDIKLAETATKIVDHRQAFTRFLARELTRTYNRLAGGRVSVKLNYQTLTGSDYPTALTHELSRRLERDQLLGYTSVGPHRDDLEIIFNNSPATEVTSRGESRSLVLSLKLLESRYVEAKSQQLPTLLFDDVFSELDEQRQVLLLELLAPQQTIITTTHLDEVKKALPKKHQLIELGK